MSKLNKVAQEVRDTIVIDENTSDGYHTFKELYEFRKLLTANLFREWHLSLYSEDYNIHKSKRHFDGELCFEGRWFIISASLPQGQITFHYKIEDWELFNIPEKEKCLYFDGHTSQDVLDRLKLFLEDS